MGFEAPSLSPDRVTLFGDFSVPVTMITLWVVSAIVIIFAIVFKCVIFKNFQKKPKGFQNIIELGLEAVNKMSKGQLGKMVISIAPYMMMLAVALVLSGLAELVGVRAPATDLNFTISLALMSFVLINAYAIKARGLWGRIKWFGKPIKFIAPIKLLTQLATPISLACRLFGNLFSGLIIMELIYYALGYFAVGIPAVLSIYFNLFHVGMQTYVFMTLTLAFIKEGIED